MSIPVAQLNLWLGVVCWVAALSAGAQDRVVVNSPAQAVPKSPGRQADAWRDAVLKGDAAKVKELLAARPELAIALDSFGKHWLHVAADAGHEEVVALLLEAKADCNAPGDRLNSIGSLETPLHIAARRGHPGIVRRLLEAGALVNSRASSGTTPLLLALTPRERHLGVEQLASASETNRTGRIESIRLLCQAGADPFAPERLFNRTNTPIQAASTPGHGMWLDLLLTNARPRTVRSPDGHSLLDIARQQGRLEALAMLAFPDPAPAAVKGELNPLQVLVWQSPPGPRLVDGTRLEPRHYWELLIAGQEPDLFTRIGLEDRAGVEAWIRDNPGQLALVRDAEGRTPLHWALAKGYVDLAVRLAELGADAETRDASGRSPLFYAIETGQLALLRQLPALVRRVQRDDTFPVSPLELALIKGHAEVGKFLLELNPDVGRPCLNGGTLLHLAVVKAPELVEALVTAGVPLDAVDRAGRLPLHEAARLGHVELLGRLLHPPALVHQPDKSGRTAFELAVLAGQLGAVDFFLKRKPDLARRDPAGASLLHLAVQSRQPDLVVRLLTAGADPDLTDLAGRTPLHMAAGQGLDDILIKLLNANAPTNARDRDGRTAVELALVGGHASTARLLLQLEKWRPDLAARQTTPLHLAAATGQLELVRELAAAVPTPDLRDEHGQTPLVLAAGAGHFALIPPLVERGADINATNAAGQTSGLMALQRSNWDQALALRRLGADLSRADTNGNTALHLAMHKQISNTAGSGWLTEFQRLVRTNLLPQYATFTAWLRTNDTLASLREEITARQADGKPFNANFADVWQEPWKFVLALGADAKATNRLGQTPLHIMAGGNYFYESTHTSRVEVVVAELVRRGLDPNGRDAAGRTALHEAAQRARWQIVQSLLQQGADVNVPARDGQTALHLALQERWPHRGVAATQQALIRGGANVNARDTNGQTVLHYFSRLGDRDLDPSSGPVVAEFLKAQPDVNAPDHEGDTPLHLAVRAGRKELASLLNQHGAHPLLKNKAGETPMAMVDKASPNMQWQRPNLLPPGAKADPTAAAAGGDLDSLKVWLALDPVRVISTNGVLLNAAASRCRTNVVEFLVSNGVPLNAFAALMTGQTNEFAALLSGQPEAARSRWPHAPRTDRFVTVHGSGSRTVTVQAPLLHHAVALGNGGAVGMLLEAGADVDAADSEGHTALYRSLTNETTQLAARLRAAGAAENAIDLIAQNHIEQLQGRAAKALAMAPTNRAEGPHPLVFALQRTNVAAVKLLLDAGADPDTPAPEAYGFPIPFYPGTTNVPRLLHVAVERGQVDMTRLLLANRADVRKVTASGETPLHLAAARGDLELIRLLLDHGADPNAQLLSGWTNNHRIPPMVRFFGHTPLHRAVQAGQTNSIALLVRAGADLERTNAWGQTVLGMLRGIPNYPGLPPFGMSPGGMYGTLGGPNRYGPVNQPASRDVLIHFLRSLGAKEPVAGQPSGPLPFNAPRPMPQPSTALPVRSP